MVRVDGGGQGGWRRPGQRHGLQGGTISDPRAALGPFSSPRVFLLPPPGRGRALCGLSAGRAPSGEPRAGPDPLPLEARSVMLPGRPLTDREPPPLPKRDPSHSCPCWGSTPGVPWCLLCQGPPFLSWFMLVPEASRPWFSTRILSVRNSLSCCPTHTSWEGALGPLLDTTGSPPRLVQSRKLGVVRGWGLAPQTSVPGQANPEAPPPPSSHTGPAEK